MRARRPVAAALLSLAITGLAGPAVAGSPRGHATALADPVGGPLLTGRGVVEQPLPGAPALPTDLTSATWLVADLDTGDVLAAKGPHEKYLPASTLKTLTALTLIPRLDPNQMVKASWRDAAVDGSKVGIVPGMRYAVR